MSIDEVLNYIREHRAAAEWYIIGKVLRCRFEGNVCCPLTFVCMHSKRKWFWPYEAFKAADELAMPQPLAKLLAGAADNTMYPATTLVEQTEVRNRLMDACGMKSIIHVRELPGTGS